MALDINDYTSKLFFKHIFAEGFPIVTGTSARNLCEMLSEGSAVLGDGPLETQDVYVGVLDASTAWSVGFSDVGKATFLAYAEPDRDADLSAARKRMRSLRAGFLVTDEISRTSETPSPIGGEMYIVPSDTGPSRLFESSEEVVDLAAPVLREWGYAVASGGQRGADLEACLPKPGQGFKTGLKLMALPEGTRAADLIEEVNEARGMGFAVALIGGLWETSDLHAAAAFEG